MGCYSMKDNKYRNYNVIGSNAVVTDTQIEKREINKKKNLEKSRRERRLRTLAKERQKKKNILQIVSLVFIFGTIVVSGNASIYKMQKQLLSLNSQIKEVKSENEALEIDLLKVSSLENIKEFAEKKLNMVNPDKGTIIRQDISKANFKEIENTDSNKTLLSKIKDALF